jgi:hypothetical protein
MIGLFCLGGSGESGEELDQPLQNSLRNTIAPALLIDLQEKDVPVYKILAIRIPLWNKKDVYQYEGRVYLRQGINVFIAKPEQTKKLHAGIPLV